ncbi:MAG: hypothetical protein ACTSU2_13695 [Promethearchaeota archaeon]
MAKIIDKFERIEKRINNNYFFKFEGAMNIFLFLYLFIRMGISVWRYGLPLYAFSFTLFMGFIIALFILNDWVFLQKNVLYSYQILFSIALCALYSILVIVSLVFHLILTIGFFLFLILAVLKIVRIKKLIQSERREDKRFFKDFIKSLKFSLKIMKGQKLKALALMVLILVPGFVFGIGITSHSLSSFEINLNNKSNNNDNSGSAFQISFYADIRSYDYLTNKTILSLLNWTALKEEYASKGIIYKESDYKPAEILLLVRETYLNDSVNAGKLAEIIRNCTNSGIHVWTWFVYTHELGYYPSYEDYKHLPEFKSLFDSWVSNYSLNIYGILFDNEMDEYTNVISWNNFISYIGDMINYRISVRNDWNNAVNEYTKVINEWKAEGYKVGLIGMEMALYDMLDGDPDLQQMGGIINDPPNINVWDNISYMLYRHCESRSEPTGIDTFYALSKLERSLYGEKATVAIGCMGRTPYDKIDGILKDIALVKSLGYNGIQIFVFQDLYTAFGYNGLASILNSSLANWQYPKYKISIGAEDVIVKFLLLAGDIYLGFY